MTISLGNDHAGVEYKKQIIDYLKNKNFEIINHGTNTKESVDYPDFIHPVAQDIKKGKAAIGIIICGSGNGAAMTANKYKEIRAELGDVLWYLARMFDHYELRLVEILHENFLKLTDRKNRGVIKGDGDKR